MKLLMVLPYCASDAPQAERLCDWCFELNGRRASGNILLVAASDVHEEMRVKVKLAAEVAFETVDVLVAQPIADAMKTVKINRTFQQGAEAVAKHFQWPFLWLEPDCVPLKYGWLGDIGKAYEHQPKRYLAPHLKLDSASETVFMGRVGVYPNSVAGEIGQFTANTINFERAGGETLLARSTKTRLIQMTTYESVSKIREDALLLHSDKTGDLISFLSKDLNGVPEVVEKPQVTAAPTIVAAPQNDGFKSPFLGAPKPRRVPWNGVSVNKPEPVLNAKG